MSRDLATQRDLATPREKLLVGYSDVTVLHEFVRNRWGWKTLHAVMPASDWNKVEPDALRATFDLVKRIRPALKYESTPLWWIEGPPPRDVTGELIGGNLSLVHTLAGTPYEYDPTGKILFLEDIGEKIYAIDRYVVQMEQAGMFDGLAAIVLGDFTDCRDEDNTMLNPDESARSAGGPERVPLRPTFSLETGLSEIFGRIARERGIPLARGLPVGHGPNFWPLPLGARYTLTRHGLLKLDAWDWLTASPASS
jgi:muramoyltetrapeptide carboxypeptidase